MTPMLAEIVMNISSSETLTALKIKGFSHMVPWLSRIERSPPKKALNASLCVADLIGMGFKTYRVADKPLPKPSVEGKSSPRYDKENKYDFIIIFLIKAELK